MEATPFSRYLAGKSVPGSPILKRPIKVLVAIAAPANLQQDYGLFQIDSDDEWKLLQEAIGDTPQVELVRLPDPCTLPAIEAELRKGYHILHFLGHGQFSAKSQRAALFLADDDNQVSRTYDTEFAEMLGRRLADAGRQADDKLRLVHLSSCQTGERSPADAFRGLAPQLVVHGVPAVLAMQDFIPVETAHEFSRAFYRVLLEHGVVDRAANEARGTLITAKAAGRPNLPGSAIPVLFMRLRSGLLFGEKGMMQSLEESARRRGLDVPDLSSPEGVDELIDRIIEESVVAKPSFLSRIKFPVLAALAMTLATWFSPLNDPAFSSVEVMFILIVWLALAFVVRGVWRFVKSKIKRTS